MVEHIYHAKYLTKPNKKGKQATNTCRVAAESLDSARRVLEYMHDFGELVSLTQEPKEENSNITLI